MSIEVEPVNWFAGPAKLVPEVEAYLRKAITNFAGTRLSILSTSHRTTPFEVMLADAIKHVRELLDVPKDYAILFVPGGAAIQFKGWLLNLIKPGKPSELLPPQVAYLISGHWGNEAYQAGLEFSYGGFCRVRKFRTSERDLYRSFPRINIGRFHVGKQHFVHVVTNETVNGTRAPMEALYRLARQGWVLVADASSDIMARRIDITQFGMVYAAAQKNIGPPGSTLIIVRKNLIDHAPHPFLSAPMSYRAQVEAFGGLKNTPDTIALLGIALTLKWIREQGGVAVMEARARERADLLYSTIDTSDGYFAGIANPSDRSDMNVLFQLADTDLRPVFLAESIKAGFVGIKGHATAEKYLGVHIRVSIYNAATLEDVRRFIEFMHEFRTAHANYPGSHG